MTENNQDPESIHRPWAAYGRIGTPIFRLPGFEGKPTLEGHLATDGLYADVNQPFQAKAWSCSTRTLTTSCLWPRQSLGLAGALVFGLDRECTTADVRC